MLDLCDNGAMTSSCGTSVGSVIALYSDDKMYSDTKEPNGRENTYYRSLIPYKIFSGIYSSAFAVGENIPGQETSLDLQDKWPSMACVPTAKLFSSPQNKVASSMLPVCNSAEPRTVKWLELVL